MSAEHEYATPTVDLLESFGHCAARRMFGGYGIFQQGLMFGPIAEGRSAFCYFVKEREYRLYYCQAPDEFFEDSTACRRWAHIAFIASLHNPSKRKRPRP